MQCRNGGWGSFDRDNTKMIFQYIPFADHNAMLDPPSVDITGACSRCWPSTALREPTSASSSPSNSSSAHRSRTEAGSAVGASTIFTERFLFCAARCYRRRPPRAANPAGSGVDSHGAESDGGWARPAALTTILTRAALVRARLRKRMGDARPACRGRRSLRLRRKGVRWLLERSMLTEAGKSRWRGPDAPGNHHGTGFPKVFYLAYTMYRQYFRSWRSPRISVRWKETTSLQPEPVACSCFAVALSIEENE